MTREELLANIELYKREIQIQNSRIKKMSKELPQLKSDLQRLDCHEETLVEKYGEILSGKIIPLKQLLQIKSMISSIKGLIQKRVGEISLLRQQFQEAETLLALARSRLSQAKESLSEYGQVLKFRARS